MSTERERAQRLKLPTTVVGRIVKQALPEHAKIGIEARSVVSRAASVFVLNLASFATDHAHGKKRRMVTAEDVIQAMKGLECDRLESRMSVMIEAWKHKKAEKTIEAAKRRADKKAQAVIDAACPPSKESDNNADEMSDDLPDTMPILQTESEVYSEDAEAVETDDTPVLEESVGVEQFEADA